MYQITSEVYILNTICRKVLDTLHSLCADLWWGISNAFISRESIHASPRLTIFILITSVTNIVILPHTFLEQNEMVKGKDVIIYELLAIVGNTINMQFIQRESIVEVIDVTY